MRQSALFVVAVACVLIPSCSSPTSPSSAPLTKVVTTEHFVFRMADGDGVNTAWQESFHAWAVVALDVSPSRQVTYNKYMSRAHMGDLIGVGNTNAYADANSFTLHTIWSTDNHETVHLYASTFANPGPVALFNEGLAVAHQVNPPVGDFVPKWSGTPVDDLARSFKAAGRLIPLGSIIETSGFRTFDSNVTYPESGSFVKFVLGRFGLPAVKEFFRRGAPADNAATVRQTFQAVFGRSFDQCEQDWLAALGLG